jgi:hypothetical protein
VDQGCQGFRYEKRTSKYTNRSDLIQGVVHD